MNKCKLCGFGTVQPKDLKDGKCLDTSGCKRRCDRLKG